MMDFSDDVITHLVQRVVSVVTVRVLTLYSGALSL